MINKIKIKVGAISIKDLRLKDANKNYQSWFSSKKNFRYIENGKYKPSVDYLKNYIKSFKNDKKKKTTWYLF